MRGALSLALGAFAVLVVAASGCQAAPETPSCGKIPEATGCPVSGGGSCADPSCAAIYACRDHVWALVTRCNNDLDAGVTPDGATDADAGACAAVTLPPASASCPALQAPDCDASLVDQCPGAACTTGCTGFLRCTPEGWSSAYVAYCDENGMLVMKK
jgi:hypothetical protein